MNNLIKLTEAEKDIIELINKEYTINTSIVRDSSGDCYLAEIKENQIEPLRDKLTELLSTRGFSSDYSLTADGMIIENLIDKLFDLHE